MIVVCEFAVARSCRESLLQPSHGDALHVARPLDLPTLGVQQGPSGVSLLTSSNFEPAHPETTYSNAGYCSTRLSSLSPFQSTHSLSQWVVAEKRSLASESPQPPRLSLSAHQLWRGASTTLDTPRRIANNSSGTWDRGVTSVCLFPDICFQSTRRTTNPRPAIATHTFAIDSQPSPVSQ
jgi:hypothetical protein